MVFQALQSYHLCQVVPVSFSLNSLWLLFFSDYGKYEQSIETSTDPEDHDGVWKTGLIEILCENSTVNFF